MTESLCDTISIFATDSVAQTETQTPFYEDMGFFQGDSLMHPEVKAVRAAMLCAFGGDTKENQELYSLTGKGILPSLKEHHQEGKSQ